MSKIDWQHPFKPQDFLEVWQPLKATTMQEAAHIANVRFRELLEQAQKVTGRKDVHGGLLINTGRPPTHSARLVDIKELLGNSEQLEKK